MNIQIEYKYKLLLYNEEFIQYLVYLLSIDFYFCDVEAFQGYEIYKLIGVDYEPSLNDF